MLRERGRCESASEGIRPLEDIGVNRASCDSCAGCARAWVVNLGFACVLGVGLGYLWLWCSKMSGGK